MPLLDHFHSPLSNTRDWHSFHNAWATLIATDLNTRLPQEYFAEGNVQFGIEIDVAAMEELNTPGGTYSETWSPPAATLTIPFTLETDIAEVKIYRQLGGRQLVGAIELVSPANKDRDAALQAFVTKCEGYLRAGTGLVIVDIVTSRTANTHRKLMEAIGQTASAWTASLYAASYHPHGQNGEGEVEIWLEELHVGSALPTMPLYLRGGPCVPVFLDQSYDLTCKSLRIK